MKDEENLSKTFSANNNFDYEIIDIKEIFSILLNAKLLIILITSVFAILSIFYSLSLKNYYKSEAILTIASSSPNQGGSLSGFGGLASSIGLSLPSSGGQDKSTEVIETIKSRAFVKHILGHENIMPNLLAVTDYNEEAQSLSYDNSMYDDQKNIWLNFNNKDKPSYLDVYDVYKNIVIIERDKLTQLINISVEHLSPVFAKNFIELIIKEANEIMREKDLKEASDAIDFLTLQIPKSSLITMKDSINMLVHSRLETQMMARIRKDYVLRTLEPAFIPEKKSKPNRSFICIVITIIGFLLSIFVTLVRHYFPFWLPSKLN